jgi:hypothetical protein
MIYYFFYICVHVGLKKSRHGEGVGASSLWEMGQLNFNMGPVWSEVRLMH